MSKIWSTCEAPTQRLSKPRTNTSSSNLLSLASHQSEASSPRSPTDNSIFGEDHIVTSQKGDRRSRRKSRSKIRTYLQNSGNDHAPTNSSEDEESGQRGIVNEVRQRLSRRSSSLSRFTHTRRSSTQLASTSSSRLLLNEHECTRMEQEIKEKEYAGRIAAQNHVSPCYDEDENPVTIKSPIRRRSLYAPGLATRTPHDMLRRPPPPDRQNSEMEREYYYNPNKPQSSPLSDLATLAVSRNAALASSRNGRSTPVDLVQLGGLSLGTLRITNGAASPEPSEDTSYKSNKALSDSASHDDYYTASEGCKSEDEAHPVHNKAAIETPRPPRRSGSPLKFEAQQENTPKFDLQISGRLATEVNWNPHPESQFCEQGALDGLVVTPRPIDRACSIAQDYMLELPASPYEAALPHPVESSDQEWSVTTTDKVDGCDLWHGSVAGNDEDRDFQDEGVDIPESQPRTTDYWRFFVNEAEARHASSDTKEAYRILSGGSSPRNSIVEPSDQYAECYSGDREDGGRRRSSSTTTTTNTTHSGSLGSNARTSLQGTGGYDNVDSGYNSNASLNNTINQAGAGNASPGFLKCYPKDHRSISGPRDMPQQSLRGPEACQPITTAPSRPSLMVTARPATTITTTITSSPAMKRQHTAPAGQLPLAEANNHYLGSPRSSETTPFLETPCEHPVNVASGRGPANEQSDSTIPSLTKSRKLQKSRRSSKPVPVDQITVQRIREITETTIPPIPVSISTKHAERLQAFPSLEHTYPTSHHTSPEGSQSPSPERPMVPIRFPSTTNSLEDRSDAIVSGDLDWPTKSSKKKAKDMAKERPFWHRRKSQSQPLPSIANLGDIAGFLGGSPYDAAKSSSGLGSYATSDKQTKHPHQISTRVSRPQSMIALKEDAVGETQQDPHQRLQSIPRPKIPGREDSYGGRPNPGRSVRPQSMFVTPLSHPFDNCESRETLSTPWLPSADLGRPLSMFADVPPVPRLPSPSRAKKLESKAKRLTQNGGPAVPDTTSFIDSTQDAASKNHILELGRPPSMYDTVPTQMQHQQAQAYFSRESESTPIIDHLRGSKTIRSESKTSPHIERSDTVIHRGDDVSKSTMSRTTYFDPSPVPILSATECAHQWPSRYIEESNLQNPNMPERKPVPRQFISPLPSDTADTEVPTTNSSTTPKKLHKKQPGNAKADLWKSDSLREELHKRDHGIDPALNSEESEFLSKSSSPWDNPKFAWARQQQSASVARLKQGFALGEVIRPVSAPSIHDALRSQKSIKSNATIGPSLNEVNPSNSNSSQESMRSHASSRIQPPMFCDDIIPGIVPQAPSRDAPSQPIHQPSTETPRPASSHYSITSESRSPKKSSQNDSPSGGSPPKTPRSNRESHKQKSPTISSPTANAADSYNSHAAAAPSPPAFSVPRKRVGSLPSYPTQP